MACRSWARLAPDVSGRRRRPNRRLEVAPVSLDRVADDATVIPSPAVSGGSKDREVQIGRVLVTPPGVRTERRDAARGDEVEDLAIGRIAARLGQIVRNQDDLCTMRLAATSESDTLDRLIRRRLIEAVANGERAGVRRGVGPKQPRSGTNQDEQGCAEKGTAEDRSLHGRAQIVRTRTARSSRSKSYPACAGVP